MPTTSRPKSDDKFSAARAAKNSPERQEAVEKRKYKDTPPNSVLEANKPKKKTPRGPKGSTKQVPPGYGYKSKSTGERAPDTAQPKIRDEERVYNLVHAILSAWKAEVGHAENTAASAGIIKVSRRKIEGALRNLKNTRFTKIPTLINDILTGEDTCDEFGMWVYVEHDSPDWIFVRLPENSTPVIRADIAYSKTGETSASVTTSSEVLLEDTHDEPLEMLDCDDKDIEDLETKAMRKRLLDANIIKPEAAAKLSRNDLMKLCAYYGK